MKNEEMDPPGFRRRTPYIQKYHGKTMVIKYGGNAMINETLKNAVMNDLVTLTLLGVRVVLVHGGGPAINEMLKKVGVESHFANGLRVTDDATMEIVQQVLAGKVNKDLVAKLRGRGVGLCGMDGQMLRCTELDPQAGPCGRDHPCGPHPDPEPVERRLHPGHRDGGHGRPWAGVQRQRRYRRRPDRHCAQGGKARFHDRHRGSAAG